MRAAQNHSLCIVIGKFSVQIIEIHLVGISFSDERIIDHFPAVSLHFSGKWMVNRSLDNHPVSFLRQKLN